MQGKYTPMKVPIWGTCGWRNRDTQDNRLKLADNGCGCGGGGNGDAEREEHLLVYDSLSPSVGRKLIKSSDAVQGKNLKRKRGKIFTTA